MAPTDRRSRREERREETRDELISSATKVFSASGFHAASLEQIARGAGYSTGAIYWHFGGKDELFLAKIADPDAFPDRLYGDFVQLFFELVLGGRREPVEESA